MSEQNGKASDRAEQIVEDGAQVRDRVRDLLVDLTRSGRGGIKDAVEQAHQILDGAAQGARRVAAERRGEVLGQVVDGLSDGLARAAQATRLAIEEARGRGQQFAQEDLNRAASDLRSLEEMFVRMVGDVASGAGKGLWEQVGDASTHATRAARSMRPPIEEALKAAASHPVKLTGEAASAGVAVGRQAVGSLFQAMSGLLAGAGQIVSGQDKPGGDDAG